jgi:hypothetical protein
LFQDPDLVDSVVREIEALGLSRNAVRILEEPERFQVTGVMSFPRLDFEVDLSRVLTTIGATGAEVRAYVGGLRGGGALVFVTGADGDDKIDAAAEIMNRYSAVEVDEVRGPEPYLPRVVRAGKTPPHEDLERGGHVGRIPARGSAYFVW